MALLVPKVPPPDADLEEPAGISADPAQGDYTWVREFSYRSDKQGPKHGLSYGIQLKGREATYVPLRSSYVLGKRRRQEMTQVPIPHRVRALLISLFSPRQFFLGFRFCSKSSVELLVLLF